MNIERLFKPATKYSIYYYDPIFKKCFETESHFNKNELQKHLQILIDNGCKNFTIKKIVYTYYTIKKEDNTNL